MDHPAFRNQDLIPTMTTLELKEVSDIREMKRSLTATIDYLEIREQVIFAMARGRTSNAAGGVHHE